MYFIIIDSIERIIMSSYFDQKNSFMNPVVTQYGSRMVMTNVKKSKKRMTMNLDTRFLIKNNSDYFFNLPQRITNVVSISLQRIEIPVCFFNISSTLKNNYFIVFNSTLNVQHTITIDNGNYTVITLTNKINNLLSASSITDLILSIDTTTNIASFINSSSTSTYMLDFTSTQSGLYDSQNKIKAMFGFTNNAINTYTILPLSTLSCNYMININTIRYLYFAMDDFVNCGGYNSEFIAMFSQSTLNNNILDRISINTTLYPFGSILHGQDQMTNNIRTYPGPVDILKLKITILDEYGNPIDLNGNNFSFVLEMYMEE